MANETLITDLVAKEAIEQLENLDRQMESTLDKFKDCAKELAKGLKVPVEVSGDVDKLKQVYEVTMKDLAKATADYTQQVQAQQKVVANTTNTISRQLAEQEKLNKVQRETYSQDQQALAIADRMLGTREENYRKLAELTAQMKANKQAQKDLLDAQRLGLATEEETQTAMGRLMQQYDELKTSSQNLTRMLTVQNKEANAAEGSYAQLSQQLERMKQAYKQMNAGQKASEEGKLLEAEIQKLDARLKDLGADMGEFQRNVGNYAVANGNIKKDLKEMTMEIAQLTVQYGKMSAEERASAEGQAMASKIRSLTEQAGALKDAIGDVNQSIKNVASDTRGLDTIAELGRLSAAAFGLASSAASAFGASEEEVQKAMLKVQAAMQAVQGLTVIQNALQKQSNLMMGIAIIQEKAKAVAVSLSTKETVAATAAQKIFNAVANANPYVLLATGIAAVVGACVLLTTAFKNNSTEAERNAERMRELDKAAGETAASEMAHAKALYTAATKAASGTKERTAAIKALQKEYPKYFGNLNAEKATVEEMARAYRQLTADILRSAKARAAEDKLVEAFKKQYEIEERRKKLKEAETLVKGNKLAELGLKAAQKYGQFDSDEELNKEDARVQEDINYYSNEAAKGVNLNVKSNDNSGGSSEFSPSKSKSGGKSDAEKAAEERKKLAEQLASDALKTENDALKKSMEQGEAEIIMYYKRQEQDIRNKYAGLKEMSAEETKELDTLIAANSKERDEALAKYDEELIKRKEEAAAKQVELLEKQYASEQLLADKAYSDRMNKLNEQYIAELKAAEGNAEKIAEIKAKYEEDSELLSEEYAIETIERQKKAIEEQLKVLDLSTEEREKLESELAKTEIDLADAVADKEINAIERVAEADERAREKRMKDLQDWVQKAGEALGNIASFASALFDNQIAKVQEEMDTEKESYDERVSQIETLAEQGAITQEEAEIRKRDALAETARKQEALEKKKAAMEYKKAVMEKANSIAQIGIATALGIMQTYAQLGWPAGIPGAIFIGAMGAIQAATALAQPIKAYKEGTQGKPHPGGLAIVGDGNKPEVVMFGGRAWITPDSPTLVDLPKGAEVMPDAAAMKMDALVGGMKSTGRSGQPIIINDYEALEARMANNTKVLRKGLSQLQAEIKNQRFRNYINSRL